MDQVSNAVVILAPSQLGQEVASLVKQLDENARQNDTTEISLVPLREMNAQQLQEALDDLLRSSRRRR
jgi:hypothetical protein